MPTPTLWNSPRITGALDYHSYEGFLSGENLTALGTGRYVSTDVYGDIGDGGETYLDVAVRNADGSRHRFFAASQTNDSPFDEPTTGHQVSSVGGLTTAALSGGRFVAAWTEARDFGPDRSGDGIRFQIYDQFGAPIGSGVQANTTVTGNQGRPGVNVLGDGSFVISWQHTSVADDSYGTADIRAQLFSATGAKVGSEILVDTSRTGSQSQQSVVALGGGGFVVVWQDESHAGSDTAGTAVRAQRFTGTGAKAGGEILVNTTVASNQGNPQVVALDNGGYAVFWTDDSGTGADLVGASVRGQLFGPTGARVGGEVVVNTTTAGQQRNPKVIVLDGGNVVVAWTDGEAVHDAKAQIFSDAGARVGGEFSLSTAAGEEEHPLLLALSDGNFLAVWDKADTVEVWCQLFGPTGARIGDELLLRSGEADGRYDSGVTSAKELADGRVAVAWTELGFDVDVTFFNYQVIVDPRQGAVRLLGTAAGDDLIGTGLADTIDGGAGNDTLNGGTGIDRLEGGAGNDTYIIDSAGDVVVETDGGGTADRVVAGVSYTLGSSAHVESLVTLVSSSQLPLKLTGNEFGQTIIGNAGANRLEGLGGNDKLNGALGADVLVGGAGNDTYPFLDRNDTIIDASGIDTITSMVTASLEPFVRIENLTLLGSANINGTGNALSNTITGNAGVNTLIGNGGNDVLIGGGRRDTLTGGAGADDFDFNLVTEMGKTAATRDIIRDFVHLTDDIDLSTIDANGAAAGNTAFLFVAAQGTTFTGVKGQLRWFQENLAGTVNDKTIVQGDVNGDKVADFQIQLTGLKGLTAADFFL